LKIIRTQEEDHVKIEICAARTFIPGHIYIFHDSVSFEGGVGPMREDEWRELTNIIDNEMAQANGDKA
jgi:hypothetical protein